MTNIFKGSLLPVLLLAGLLQVSACKNKKAENTNEPTIENSADVQTTAPVEVSSDASLETGARDATKDYPGVTATVANGEITLTGDIARDDLARLMPSLHALHPKKVNNNLTIK
ncbi:MAG: hypothetical protein EOP49_01810 [Sphingobacteriales bacterium]|nr:MAG: hypothetical protein EOP49_01810 [Sphingobacteriales bacterium]